MKSWGLAAIALFLACMLWFFVSAPRREIVSERAYAAPFAVIGMPRDLVITNQVPDTINVRLRGRLSALRSLISQNLEVTVDVSWVQQPGEATITLRPQAINVPAGIEVVSMDPTRLRFHIEQLRQKVVRIRPFMVGEPRAGFHAGDATAFPDQVLISGPAAQVKNVSEAATERIIMTGRTETFTQNVAVVSDSPLVRIVEPLAVDVTVPVMTESAPAPLPADGPVEKKKDQEKVPRP